MPGIPVYRPERQFDFYQSVEGAQKMARGLEDGGVADAAVALDWNEVFLTVKKDSNPDTVWREYLAECDRENERQRPAREARLKAAQLAMRDSLDRLDDCVTKGNVASTLEWLIEYGLRSSFIGVDAQQKKVLEALTAAGYAAKENQVEGMDMKDAINSLGDREKARRFVIGQVMYQMEHEQPIGQASEVFAMVFEQASLPPEQQPPETGKPTRLMRQINYKT